MKVVGFLLLGILGVIAALVLLLLFVPVRYRIMACAHAQNYSAKLSAHWLLHLIRFRASYEAGDLQTDFRILWFSFRQKENSEPKTASEEHVADTNKDKTTSMHRQDPKTVESKKSGTSKIARIQERIKRIITNIKTFFRNIQKYRRELEDARNQAALRHIRMELFRLLRYVMPHKMHLTAAFSTGSPDTTGQVLGILAMFPIGYQNRWNIQPDFTSEQFYIEGDTDLSGKIQLFHLVGIGLRLWRDKNCMRLYHRLSK